MANVISGETHQVPITELLNRFIKRLVGAVAWLNVALIIVILTTVILRYGFHRNGLLLGWGLVPMEELEWHLYSVPFMFGLAYAITNNSHIRIDIIHMAMSKRLQHFFEIFGIIFLLMPFLLIMLDFSFDYAVYSFTHNESSQSPSGLPYRWIIKSVIPLSMLLMIIAALARLIQETALLLHHGKEMKETVSARASLMQRMLTPQLKDLDVSTREGTDS
ncbi:MAG TPA: TRAP transporter small permease subunit [Arenicellales bacterium]|jgi:TRAP-type mannitol/chloroaromatic compound transport system permease small subunit|nr:TRAP transporter small permease subunit [Arenicellales bacterium]